MLFAYDELKKYYPGFVELVNNETCFNAVRDGLFTLDFLYKLPLIELNIMIKPQIISAIAKKTLTVDKVLSVPKEQLTNLLSPTLLSAMDLGVISFDEIAQMDNMSQISLRMAPRLIQLMHMRLLTYADIKVFSPSLWFYFSKDYVCYALEKRLFHLRDLSLLLPSINPLLPILLQKSAIESLKKGIYSFKDNIAWENVSPGDLSLIFRSQELLDIMHEQGIKLEELVNLNDTTLRTLIFAEGCLQALKQREFSIDSLRELDLEEEFDTVEQVLMAINGPELNRFFAL